MNPRLVHVEVEESRSWKYDGWTVSRPSGVDAIRPTPQNAEARRVRRGSDIRERRGGVLRLLNSAGRAGPGGGSGLPVVGRLRAPGGGGGGLGLGGGEPGGPGGPGPGLRGGFPSLLEGVGGAIRCSPVISCVAESFFHKSQVDKSRNFLTMKV